MTRILFAEHSPHAQRMGERILRDEGFSVITVTDGETAMLRLKDVKPQLVLADLSLSGFSGLEICNFIKSSGEHPGTKVILTLGAMELLDEGAAERVKADATIRKPFEASALLEVVSRLAPTAAQGGRTMDRSDAAETAMRPTRAVVVLDPEQIRAAVTVALDQALLPLIDSVTERVLLALSSRK